MHIDFEQAFRRIDEVIGGESDAAQAMRLWIEYFRDNLVLPCEVTGMEDFRWEEPYVLGIGNSTEYRNLLRRQPSYSDLFTLERIETDVTDSPWALHADDLGASVIRKRDGRPFLLGLSELTATDLERNAQLLQDYAIWFTNCR